MKAINIQWDTDGNDIDLPKTVIIPKGTKKDIADYLSDTYGWCVFSFGLVK